MSIQAKLSPKYTGRIRCSKGGYQARQLVIFLRAAVEAIVYRSDIQCGDECDAVFYIAQSHADQCELERLARAFLAGWRR